MLSRGFLVALIALIGAPLMLLSTSGASEVSFNSNGGFLGLLIFGLAPAIPALLLHRLLLSGHPVVRVFFMMVSTLIGIFLVGAHGVTFGELPSDSLGQAMKVIFQTGPLIFLEIVKAAPWCLLVWVACAAATLWLGDPLRKADAT